MLSGAAFTELLARHGFGFASGVPCSLIEDLIRVLERGERLSYVPAVREDIAVGIAAGAWLAGKRPVVLMQNSGLGTSMNALASMALMYGIPTLLIVTWRGHAGKDAPEHILTGDITPRHLDLMGIPHKVLSEKSAEEDVAWAKTEMDRLMQPVAILVPPGVFVTGHGAHGELGRAAAVGGQAANESFEPRPPRGGLPAELAVRAIPAPTLSRYGAIAAAVKQLGDEPVVHANGYPSRESHGIADRPQNFYMIGSMGLASSIALGIALNRPDRATVVFDGDGNLLMNLGVLPMIGARAPRRFVHCVFDNGVYGSTGNQRSAADGVRLDAVAAAAGYRTAVAVTAADDVGTAMARALGSDGPHFILVKVTPEQADVPRIAHTPAQIRDRFRATLSGS